MEYRYEPKKPEPAPPTPEPEQPGQVTAREAGAIASRVLAVLIAVQGVSFGTSLAQSYLQTPQRPASPRVSPLVLQGIPAGAMLGLALALWIGARWFWPSDVPVESSMTARDWRRLAFLLLGAYIALDAAPSAVLELFSPLMSVDIFPRRMPMWRTIADVGRLLLGVVLVMANYRIPVDDL